MKKVIPLFFLCVFSLLCFSQSPTDAPQKITTDSSWSKGLDFYEQQRLDDWIENYNKGVDYYIAKDYESANFYFEKVLRNSPKEIFTKSFWVGASHNNLTQELDQKIYFYKYIGYLKLGKLPVKDLGKAFNKVQSHCPPVWVRVAVTATEEYNATKRKKDKIDYEKFLKP